LTLRVRSRVARVFFDGPDWGLLDLNHVLSCELDMPDAVTAPQKGASGIRRSQ
jgi:hypothetical protein